MARREISFFSSSPAPAASRDVLEYLRFQFSRMVALLSFARDDARNDARTELRLGHNKDDDGDDDSGCGHGLMCRMISSVVSPAIFGGKARPIIGGEKSTQPNGNPSISKDVIARSEVDRGKQKSGGKKEKSKIGNNDECCVDPFGLSSNTGGTHNLICEK